MADQTRIEWCDATFNPWTGCQHVSPACDHCYAEAQAKRAPKTFGGWGPHAERRRTSESYWRQPLLWNNRAEKDGRRLRVFCASMADVFDNHPSIQSTWRGALWDLIDATPHLDSLLLTKRPQNAAKMLPHQRVMPNVWLGTTVENQVEADRRIPELLKVPARVRFLSCEPLLGAVDLTQLRSHYDGDDRPLMRLNAFTGRHTCGPAIGHEEAGGIGWVIAGGESGPHARPSHPDWFRSLRDQCDAAGVPFFFKQWGEWRPICQGEGDWYEPLYRSNVQAKEGEDQAAIDEARGRHCTVSQICLRDDGAHAGITEPGAWAQGTRPVLAFRTGKKAAGALLDGREHREWPTP